MTNKERENFNGMTTNERLFVSGLLNEFDQAMKRKDAPKVRALLKRVFVDEPAIDVIIQDMENH